MRARFEKQGLTGRFFDYATMPAVWLASGALLSERPNRTRWWNHRVLSDEQSHGISPFGMVHCDGVANVRKSSVTPWTHMPILNILPGANVAWTRYVVLKPEKCEGYNVPWYIGWRVDGVCHCSIVPVQGPVRMLLRDGLVWFFGLKESGTQIKIISSALGEIGDGTPNGRITMR